MNYYKSKPNTIVLLAAFNGESWIKDQIKSILNQKNTYIKLVISIDKSDDNTVKICEDLKKNNKSIEILPYGKKYGGAAKNFFNLIKSVDLQKFDYIALSDQDDIWFDYKITKSISKLNNKKSKAISSDVLAWFPDGNIKKVKKSWPQKKYDYLFESAGPGCTYLFEKNSFQIFKNFLIERWHDANQIIFHDWLIYAFYRKNNYAWHIDQEPLMKYRQHKNNFFGFNFGIKAILKRVILIKSSWYKNEIFKIKDILNIDKSLSYSFLIRNFWKLRRRPRDAFLLLLFSLFGLF